MQQQQDNMHKNYKTTDEVKETQAHNQSNNFTSLHTGRGMAAAGAAGTAAGWAERASKQYSSEEFQDSLMPALTTDTPGKGNPCK